MGGFRHIIPAFLGGEINPLMNGRIDTDQYQYGLDTCVNFVPVNEGPLVKRPGFEYICEADETSLWLGAFRFSVTQEYVIEWGEEKARFFTNGGRIETSPGVAYEAATPYAAEDAPRLATQQSYDRLYIDHPSYPPASLARSDAVTFAHAPTVLKNGPFLDQNKDEAITVTVSGTLTVGGSVTVTASAAIFAETDVGALFKIQAKDFSDIKAWEPGMKDIIIGEILRSDGKAYTAETAGHTGSIAPTHEEGSAWDGANHNDVLNDKGPYGVKWAFRHGIYGVVEITGFTSATVVTATVVKRLPDSLASVASWRWFHQAWSETRGWPGLVCHAFGRQVHVKDFDVIGSVAGDFGGGQCNFETHTGAGILAPDLAFRRVLAESDPPHWLAVDDDKIIAGTAGRELAIGAINAAEAVSGTNLKSRATSSYGSENVFPLQMGTDTVFVERGGRKLRASSYDFSRDRYVPVDLTAAAGHVTRGGILQMAYARVPHSLLYAVRADGQIVAHPDTKLEIKAFCRFVPGGNARALSAVTVVGADGKSDELWLLVERPGPGGSLRKEIWRQYGWRELGDAQDQQFFVDCGTIATVAAGVTDFTGATHLAGRAIAVLADGAVVPGIRVDADGAFSLPASAVPADREWTLVFGLPYTAEAVLMRPDIKTRAGSSQGLVQRARKVVLRLLETLGVKVGSRSASGDGPLEEVVDRAASDAMDAPIGLFSGDSEGRVDQEYTRDGKVRFVSADPVAATITAAMLSMEVDEADA